MSFSKLIGAIACHTGHRFSYLKLLILPFELVTMTSYPSLYSYIFLMKKKMCSIPRKLEIRLGEIKGLSKLLVLREWQPGFSTWMEPQEFSGGWLVSQRLRWHALLVRQGLVGQHYLDLTS